MKVIFFGPKDSLFYLTLYNTTIQEYLSHTSDVGFKDWHVDVPVEIQCVYEQLSDPSKFCFISENCQGVKSIY